MTFTPIETAINAALVANANYPDEYHNCARAEAGKVIIEAPYDYQSGIANVNAISVTAGTTASAYATIFGTTTGQDSVSPKFPTVLTPESTSQYEFGLQLAMVGSMEFSGFAVEEVA